MSNAGRDKYPKMGDNLAYLFKDKQIPSVQKNTVKEGECDRRYCRR